MALVLADRVRDTTTTTGTGTVTLSGTAPTGYQNFSVIGNGNTCYYTINGGSQWEVGIGTYSSTGPTLARTTVLSSSNSGSLVNFSAGTKDVFVTYPAEKAVYTDASNNVTLPAALNVTGNTTLTGSLTANNTNCFLGPASGTADLNLYLRSTNVYNFLYFQNAGTTFGSLIGQSTVGMYYNFGQHIFRNGAGSSEYARFDTSGNFGIGTSSPSQRLDATVSSGTEGVGLAVTNSLAGGYGSGVNFYSFRSDGATKLTAGAIRMVGAANWADAANTSSSMTFLTVNANTFAERMRITSTGNVGIGTSAPSNQLSVGGNNTATISFDWIGDNAAKASIITNFSSGEVRYAAVTNYFPTFYSNNSERMRIDLSGNVGIGTSSPGSKLHVNGSGFFSGSNSITGTGVNIEYIGGGAINCKNFTAGTWDIIDYGASTHSFYINGSGPAMRIDSSSNVKVNTSTTFGKLSVYGTTGFNADANAAISGSGSFKFRGTASGTTITTYDYLNYTAMQFIRDNGNPTNTVGSITCTDTATTYNTSSDRRLKKDIAPAGDAGAVIDAIEIVSHGWKASEGTVPFGVIAQDLHAVAPQAVHAGDAGEEVTDVWGVDYSKLVPMLIKEVQSLRARVAQLEGK